MVLVPGFRFHQDGMGEGSDSVDATKALEAKTVALSLERMGFVVVARSVRATTTTGERRYGGWLAGWLVGGGEDM